MRRMARKKIIRNINLLILSLLTFVQISYSSFAENLYMKRKPGLWEIKTETNGQAVPPMKNCIDEATDLQMQEMGNDMAKDCTKKEMKKSGDTYTMESDCNYGGSNIRSHGTFKGDFNSNYQGEFTSTYNPPMMGIKEGSTKISAKWLGNCEAGMKPGDVVMPGGMKVNISQMRGMMGGK